MTNLHDSQQATSTTVLEGIQAVINCGSCRRRGGAYLREDDSNAVGADVDDLKQSGWVCRDASEDLQSEWICPSCWLDKIRSLEIPAAAIVTITCGSRTADDCWRESRSVVGVDTIATTFDKFLAAGWSQQKDIYGMGLWTCPACGNQSSAE